jgi:hypothetical protein
MGCNSHKGENMKKIEVKETVRFESYESLKEVFVAREIKWPALVDAIASTKFDYSSSIEFTRYLGEYDGVGIVVGVNANGDRKIVWVEAVGFAHQLLPGVETFVVTYEWIKEDDESENLTFEEGLERTFAKSEEDDYEYM